MQPPTRKEWLKSKGMIDYSVRSRDRVELQRAEMRANRRAPVEEVVEEVEIPVDSSPAMSECSLCCELVAPDQLRTLTNCQHVYCEVCLKKHIRLSITENRIQVPCPGCPEPIHPADIKTIWSSDPDLIAKYENFTVRFALLQVLNARWCPAPDCGFAAIYENVENCMYLKCQRPGCSMKFCFECKKPWQTGRGCHIKRRTIRDRMEGVGEAPDSIRPCPRCGTLIHKIDDGSCNHMKCLMCRAEFCWLCLREITDLHYMSPTGCTFWGKKTWSRKKKLMWQLGSLLGSPVVIAATAVVSVPLICGIIPFAVGRRVYKRLKGGNKAKRFVATAAAVTGSAVVSPMVAGFTVAVCVPLAIGYTYIMVPKALLLDALDYLKTRRGPENTSRIAPEPVEFPGNSAYVTTTEYVNSDGTPPGPSSAATSSVADYSDEDDETVSVVWKLGTDSESDEMEVSSSDA